MGEQGRPEDILNHPNQRHGGEQYSNHAHNGDHRRGVRQRPAAAQRYGQGGSGDPGGPGEHQGRGAPASQGVALRSTRQRREIPAAIAGTPIVVDGSNIAWLECAADGRPRLDNILQVRDELTAKGFSPIIICDAALYHQIDEPQRLNQLINEQVIQQAPAQTDGDYFVLETADRLNAQVVSDDQYKPYLDRYAWVPQRRVPVMIVAGMVEFYEERLEEPGPGAAAGRPHP